MNFLCKGKLLTMLDLLSCCILAKSTGAAVVAPMINPYEPSMTKEEMRSIWGESLPRRKLMYYLARRLPKLLSFFYRQSFLSGKHGRIEKLMSVSLGRRVSQLLSFCVNLKNFLCLNCHISYFLGFS